MNNKESTREESYLDDNRMVKNFRLITGEILLSADKGVPLAEFLRENCRRIIEFSDCDSIEISLRINERYYRCLAEKEPNFTFNLETITTPENKNEIDIPFTPEYPNTESDLKNFYSKESSLPFITESGSFWTGNLKKTNEINESGKIISKIDDSYNSIAIIPFGVEKKRAGLFILKSKEKYFFTSREINFYEGIAQTFSLAINHQRAQSDLRERIKELTCLYGIARIGEKMELELEEILQKIVNILPPGWQYPDITSARIEFDGKSFETDNYEETDYKQTADIIVGSDKRGKVEVVYNKDMPKLDEGPFLKEERNLLDTIAKEITLIVERKHVKEEKAKLREQLRHADRLATLGQLAAGVAHELNEPLANILGFSQLALKGEDTPEQIKSDIEKIKKASLHAREVVKKLLLFARQMPTKKSRTNINKIVEEGLYFLESRCQKEGIELNRMLSENLPEITVDSSQLHQVLVNLVVNAIQAMPNGGELNVSTAIGNGNIKLIVEDTGIGMDKEIIDKIFVPFFTTKDVGEGTGLGLPVVHGIIKSHGGEIDVESEPDMGSKFVVKLPINKNERKE